MADTAKLSVALRVFGDDLDPAAITSLLGCAPTRSWRRGDALTTPSGSKAAPKKTGLWSLSINADGDNVDQSLALLLTQLGGRTKKLSNAPGIDQAKFDVFVIDDEKSMKQYRLQLSPEVLRELGETGIPVEISIETIED